LNLKQKKKIGVDQMGLTAGGVFVVPTSNGTKGQE